MVSSNKKNRIQGCTTGYRKSYFDFEKIPPHLRLSEEKIKEILRKKIKEIRDYFKKSGFKKAVVGVSGGLDSAVAAVLATKALGYKNVYLAHLPYLKITPGNSYKDIKKLAKNLKIPNKNLIFLPINKIIDLEWEILKKQKGGDEKIRKGNLMCRERMKILFDLSSVKKAIVVGSEDRTERELGYFTLWGDEASGIEVIKNLWKIQVHQLANHLKEIPEEILLKAPSPDIWKGQKAEKEMGINYLEADIVLSAKKDLKMSENEISKKFKIPKRKIKKILERTKIGQIKSSLPYQLKN
jgi:NAD+ synthase